MGTPSFRFKQFTVFHDKCAMKVGTDGVLLGAWANVSDTQSVLDIGTGSGLIALMIAQRSNANIMAIDIDENAVKQAIYNFNNSIWREKIETKLTDLKTFTTNTNIKFDLIVSNPPFFNNSLHTPNIARTNARHATEGFHFEILLSAKKLLNPHGRLCIILPVNEAYNCIDFGKTIHLFCSKKVNVYPKPDSEKKRLLLEFQPTECECIESELTIESNQRHVYSLEFSKIVKDFYLNV